LVLTIKYKHYIIIKYHYNRWVGTYILFSDEYTKHKYNNIKYNIGIVIYLSRWFFFKVTLASNVSSCESLGSINWVGGGWCNEP